MSTEGYRRTGSGGDSSLNYAAIGATQSEEILQYPPKGYRAFQSAQRLGSGQERFETAARSLMTWGALRGSGIKVTDIQAETDDVAYAGVEFGEDGRAVGPATPPEEELFAPDGTPFVAAGMTAVLVVPFGPWTGRSPVKVVYVIDEPKRVGFAYGTRNGNPAEAELLMFIEQHDDGAVWLTVRSLSRPSSKRWKVAGSMIRLAERRLAKRFLTSLHPTRTAGGGS